MDLDLPQDAVQATDLEELSGLDVALPVLLGKAGEIVSFCAIDADSAALFAYSPFGGWRTVTTVDRDDGAAVEAIWDRLCDGTFDGTIPDCMEAFTDIDEAREMYRLLLDGE